jgi:hypothetical protein
MTAYPLSGYFELANKSEEFIAVKLLWPGSDTLFEAPRPVYLAGIRSQYINLLVFS